MMFRMLTWLLAFGFEVALFTVITYAIYSYLWKYLITRYTLAYPGLLLMYNIMGWVFAFCVFWGYSLLDLFYDAFFGDGVDENSDAYITLLNTGMIVSTVVVTCVCCVSIYNQESLYWKSRRVNKKLKT